MVPEPNSLGFYYRPDSLHYSQADLHTWLSVLKNLQVRWLVLQASEERIPQPFLQGLQLAGISPIVHIPAGLPAIKAAAFDDQLAAYAGAAVRYVCVGDRPNLRSVWKASDWARGGLVDQFLDRYLPIWDLQLAHGLQPVFPPLEPGGDYWDTAFLQSCLHGLQRRARTDLARQLVVAVYAWTHGKPLDWGAGGPAAWPAAKPYLTPDECQDQRGARIVDWYSAIAREALGEPLELLVLAGGAEPESRAAAGKAAAEVHAELARSILLGEYAEHVRAFCFYTLTADEGDPAGWYDRDLAATPSAEVLERLMLAVPEPKIVSSPIKPIAHYVLLPAHGQRDLSNDWKNIEPLVMAIKPVIGFSVDEARLARQVIMIGDSRWYPEGCERSLRDQGCNVRRFADAGSEELLLAIPDLAARNSSPGADHV